MIMFAASASWKGSNILYPTTIPITHWFTVIVCVAFDITSQQILWSTCSNPAGILTSHVPDCEFITGRKAADVFRPHEVDAEHKAANAIPAEIRRLDVESDDALAR